MSEAEAALARRSTPDARPTASAPPPSEHAAPPVASQPASSGVADSGPKSWEAVTIDDIDRDLLFDHLPPDSGIISPIASRSDAPDPEVATAVERLRQRLADWAPARVADPVQRTRNYLYILAVPDLMERPLERFAPPVVFDRLQREIPKEDLIKVLYWIAMHPEDGDDSAIDQLRALGIENDPGDPEQARERVVLYGVKLLGRLLGRIQPS